MERHRCKLCYRNFSNGRALGGHMRSHVTNLSSSRNYPPSKRLDRVRETEQQCSSSQGEAVLHEGESDGDSSEKRSRSRGKRRWKATASNEERSSASDITAEEAVARCLMMLSRDRWEGEDDDVSEDSSRVKRGRVGRGKYRCETCGKVFKSYQALGGHRASYKKIKAAAHGGAPAAATEEEKVHECPFCRRVFASGQALGGHKRSHFMGSSSFANFSRISRIGERFQIIDLNLPAPVDDGDEINFSQL